MPIRVALGSALWLAVCFGLVAIPLELTDTVGALILVGMATATVGLGYYVGSWWAMLVPTLSVVGLDVPVAGQASGGDSGAAFAFWLILLLLGPVALLVWLGIALRHRTVDDREIDRVEVVQRRTFS